MFDLGLIGLPMLFEVGELSEDLMILRGATSVGVSSTIPLRDSKGYGNESSSESLGEGGERNFSGISFGGAGPAGVASFGEATAAYLDGLSLDPVNASFGGVTGFGDGGAICSSYMSSIWNVENSSPPMNSSLCGRIGTTLASFIGCCMVLSAVSSSGTPGDLPPETTTSLIISLSRLTPPLRKYFS